MLTDCREGEKQIGCHLHAPHSVTKQATQVCALAGKQICDCSVLGGAFQPAEPPRQVIFLLVCPVAQHFLYLV